MSIQTEIRKESYRAMKESGKLTGQQATVYDVLKAHINPLTPYEIQTYLEIHENPMLITSIRRALTELYQDNKIRAIDTIKEKYGVKNTRYTVKAEDLF